MSTKIYTKTGDKGQTGLIGNVRVSKADQRLEAYGTLDELNAALGLCLVSWPENMMTESRAIVIRSQHLLFNLGGRMACADHEMRKNLPHISENDILVFEKEIDRLSNSLPELKAFILAGGSMTAAWLHFARTICRRAERMVVAFYENHPEEKDDLIIRFLNRFSDYLFVAARGANQTAGYDDVEWRKD